MEESREKLLDDLSKSLLTERERVLQKVMNAEALEERNTLISTYNGHVRNLFTDLQYPDKSLMKTGGKTCLDTSDIETEEASYPCKCCSEKTMVSTRFEINPEMAKHDQIPTDEFNALKISVHDTVPHIYRDVFVQEEQ